MGKRNPDEEGDSVLGFFLFILLFPFLCCLAVVMVGLTYKFGQWAFNP